MPAAFRSRIAPVALASVVSLTLACGEEAGSPSQGGPETTGLNNTAGAVSQTATTQTSDDVTGMVAIGGTTAVGGSPAAAMDSAGGSSTDSGGASNPGGAVNSNNGGMTAIGNATVAGMSGVGMPDAGGATASEGASGMGGAVSIGGSPAAGGGFQMGGAPSVGGAANGGSGGSPDNDMGADSTLIGWASVSDCGPNGTTGGGGGPPTVTVSSSGEFASAMNSGGPLVIEVSGQFNSPGELGGVRDKTILGTNAAEIRGGLILSGARNVIFKDVVFSDGNGDTFELTGSECIWFDHCEFRDGSDGNLDIVRASNFVTVSWTRFYYTRGHDHMLSNLCGNENDRPADEGKINITFHHNWWGAGVRSRQPRVRYGQVHVFNNYYHYTPVAGDGGHVGTVAAGQYSKLLVENNYFDGNTDPIYWQSDEGTAEVVERGNEFINTSGDRVSRGASFTPPYDYTMDPGAETKDIVMNGAGAR